jgi:hypothetical protein
MCIFILLMRVKHKLDFFEAMNGSMAPAMMKAVRSFELNNNNTPLQSGTVIVNLYLIYS